LIGRVGESPTVSKLWILKPGVENAQMGEGVG
jgi:hypothetical protein